MNYVATWFFSMAFPARVAAILFVLISVFGGILGRIVFPIFSIIPFFLQKVCRGIFLIVEVPVSEIHRRIGRDFFEIENKLTSAAESVDRAIGNWYGSWRTYQGFRPFRAVLVFLGLLVVVLVPGMLGFDSGVLNVGRNVYCKLENKLEAWSEKQGWYDAKMTFSELIQEEKELDEQESPPKEIPFIVTGVTTSLLVRDQPSTETGIELDRVYEGDAVMWTGKMTFAEGYEGKIDLWANVITENGIEGWSRMYYLRPENYEGVEFGMGE